MFKKILIGLAVILAVFLVVVAIQPAEFKITRSITIAAPPVRVFPLVNDFHRWNDWSPWDKMDPDMKKTYEGPMAGMGATYGWSGNNKVGQGKMTIIKSEAPSLVMVNLEFQKPMKAVNLTEFTFSPEGQQTLVTWSMSGKNGFVGKAFGMMMNMDKMVGADFEKGLAQLKELAETGKSQWNPKP